MELQPSSDQQLFRDTTARFLENSCPLTQVRALAEQPDGFEREWWRQAAELGWTSMLAPPEHGGGGVSDAALRDLGLVGFERGRLVSPGPYVPVNLVVAALAMAEGRTPAQDELIGELMAGAAIATAALDEPGRTWGARDLRTRARRDGDEVVIEGRKSPVEAGAQAEAFVVSVSLAGEPALVLVPADAAGVVVTARGTVDLVRRYASVDLEAVRVPASAVLTTGTAAVERLGDLAAALQLPETVGAIDRCFELTVEWGFDRYSFGRPLVAYQELKHRYADMKLWLEASKATVVEALTALDAGRADATELISVAKAYVDHHAPELVQDCVQLHGGIGVTWDHDLHLYLRRVTLNAGTYGTVGEHRQRLASLDLQGA